MGLRLTRLWRSARRAATRSRYCPALVLGSDGGAARALQRLGFGVVHLDPDLHPDDDITDPSVMRRVLGWIRSGCLSCVWVEPDTATWLRQSPAVRSKLYPRGLPTLANLKARSVRIANLFQDQYVRVLSECCYKKVPAILCHPDASFLWDGSPCISLANQSSSIAVFDSCMYAGRVKNRFRLVSWNVKDIDRLSVTCSPVASPCRRTQKRHLGELGIPSFDRQMRNAARYPPACILRFACEKMANSVDSLRYVSRLIRCV